MNSESRKLFACTFLCFAILPGNALFAQKIDIEFEYAKTPTDASLRGLSVVNDRTVWASGSQRTVIHTTDGGKSWSKHQIGTKEDLEFRDIHGFGTDSAFVLSAGSPGLILQTRDGNKSWQTKYQNDSEKIFFDAFDFWDSQTGIAFSDPLEGKLFLVKTVDGGQSWKSLASSAPNTFRNEAGFAASGTCLATFGNLHVWVGLGGEPGENESPNARVMYSKDGGETWKTSDTTIPRSASAGIFSLTFLDEDKGFAIGGDYKQPEITKDNFSITVDGGLTWRSPKTSTPSGFRSCIAFTKVKDLGWVLVSTGTNGTDISTDLGESWSRASKQGFHAISFSPGKTTGWASGGSGRVAKFRLKTQKRVDEK